MYRRPIVAASANVMFALSATAIAAGDTSEDADSDDAT